MARPIPAWDTVQTADVILLERHGQSPHVLYVSPGFGRDPGKDALKTASHYVLTRIIRPLTRRKLGPQLTRAIAAIERAHTDRMYKLVLKIWAKARPKGFPKVTLHRQRFGELLEPTDGDQR